MEEAWEARRGDPLSRRETKGWEVVCPDGRVRSYPFHNFGDADLEARMKTQRRCQLYPKQSDLEASQPPCPGGKHTTRTVVFNDRPDEVN